MSGWGGHDIPSRHATFYPDQFIEKEGGVRLNPTDVSLDNLDSIERILRFVEARRAEA